jgi:hypothetical protein
MQQIHASEFNKSNAEMGALMADEWNPTVRNLSASFEARLLLDLLSPAHRQRGCFVAAIQGKRLGNFDVVYEPRAPEQIVVGQVKNQNNLMLFDVWTSFEAAPFRKGARKRPPGPEIAGKDYRIEATLDPDLRLRAVTRVKVTVTESGERVLAFDIAGRMTVSSATIDGEPAEVLQPESLRSNLIRNNGNDLFLVVTAQPLEAGRDHEVEFHHEGAVVEDAGNQVYFVGPRGTWYPNSNMQFARYDLTFKYPKGLDLVTPGDVVSDKTEGEWRITRRVTEAPIRFAGLIWASISAHAYRGTLHCGGVCQRAVEKALAPKPRPPSLNSASRSEVRGGSRQHAATDPGPASKALKNSQATSLRPSTSWPRDSTRRR